MGQLLPLWNPLTWIQILAPAPRIPTPPPQASVLTADPMAGSAIFCASSLLVCWENLLADACSVLHQSRAERMLPKHLQFSASFLGLWHIISGPSL